jgi:hypothetical protein
VITIHLVEVLKEHSTLFRRLMLEVQTCLILPFQEDHTECNVLQGSYLSVVEVSTS